MSLFNPFEQFEIKLILPLILNNVDISFSNLTLLLISSTFFILTLTYSLDKSYLYIPNNWQITMESTYLFVYSIVSEQGGRKAIKYLPHLFTIFFLILFFNITGLTPFTFTATSHIIITFSLALSYYIAWIIIGIKQLKTKFLYVFCPRNMPGWLLPLLISVEFLSFLLRPISLGIRLFANMLAGHILLHILSTACIYLLTKLLILTIPAFIIIGAIAVLELGIAFLQAYIFTILLAIYLKDSLYSH
jgi:ATP synthase subunit 6